jgi:glycosyltransferase involved in cell wall biosynthesis
LREQAPVTFYDALVRKFLVDYVTGNPRMLAAVSFAIGSLPGGKIDVLDVGCGIGWSTFEIARNRTDAVVRGVDLSPRLVQTAKTLFGDRRVAFDSGDFIRDGLPARRFDAIVLIDVYEHFPLEARPKVHSQLRALLKDDGRLILTTPTVDHQEFLRRNRPEGLQPIDEDVSPKDLQRLADDVRGRVVSENAVSIWRPGDYMHAIVETGDPRPPAAMRARIEPLPVRKERIQRSLGLRWTGAAGFAAARGSADVCVATSSVSETETFVQQHIEDLPARVHLPTECLLPTPAARAVESLARALGKDPQGVVERVCEHVPRTARASLNSRYFRRHGVGVVLAEFGPNAVEMHRACQLAGIPLVIHFHGYDAFRTDVVEWYGNAYRAIFREGWPVIAVSEAMKRQLVRLGAEPGQVHVVPCGVDVDAFRPGEPTPGLVVAVGRFVDKKAPELALLAFAQAARRVPDSQLVMIGDGPLRPGVERLISALRLGDRVRLDGMRDHAWVVQTMRRASVFLQHSVVAENGDREGTPVSVLEACAAGVPVVATRHEGIAEVVVDGETGVLVEEGDIDGMGTALADLLLDPARARRLGLAARHHIEHSRSREAAIGQLWDVLERAMTDSRPRAA